MNASKTRGTMTDQAYSGIKSDIVHNKLKQGQCLSENEMAEKYGMSRTPIREAVRMLAKEGYVTVHNGVGIFVRHITNKEVHDLYEVRAALECLAAGISIDRITDAEIEALRGEWLEVEKTIESGGAVEDELIGALDFKLHFMIIERCDNQYLKDIYDGIRDKMLRLQYVAAAYLFGGGPGVTISDHLQILDYLQQKDAEGLCEILKEHVDKSMKSVIEKASLAVF
jgi:DNA-binding GntR family transcriptional regulator